MSAFVSLWRASAAFQAHERCAALAVLVRQPARARRARRLAAALAVHHGEEYAGAATPGARPSAPAVCVHRYLHCVDVLMVGCGWATDRSDELLRLLSGGRRDALDRALALEVGVAEREAAEARSEVDVEWSKYLESLRVTKGEIDAVLIGGVDGPAPCRLCNGKGFRVMFGGKGAKEAPCEWCGGRGYEEEDS